MRKVFTYFKSLAGLGLVTSLGLLGTVSCGGDTMMPDTMMPTDTPPTEVMEAPQPQLAFEHDGTLSPVGNVFGDGTTLPDSQSQRLHYCGKLHYQTLGTILKRRGVNTAFSPTQACSTTFDCTAGNLYTNGNLVLGQANYPARAPETDRSTTGGIVRMQDILIAAAEELVTTGNASGAFGAATDCAGAKLFNDTPTTCNADGFACFVGVPLTAAQLQLCNQMVADPQLTDPIVAKRLTLAAVAATIYLCD